MIELTPLVILTAIAVGATAGYIGAYMVIRRMALVGDALSHVALPGVALAYVYHFNPFVGAFATLFAGIVIVWLIEHKTNLSTESVIGLIFTFALATGLLIMPDEDILHALVGDIAKISAIDAITAIVLCIVIVVVMRLINNNLILSTISEELAATNRVKIGFYNFIFLLLVTIIVAIGIKAVGTLLMGALVVIPAVAAKNIGRSLRGYVSWSAAFGAISLVLGIIGASITGLPPGPLTVVLSTVIFGGTLLVKP